MLKQWSYIESVFNSVTNSIDISNSCLPFDVLRKYGSMFMKRADVLIYVTI